MTTSKTKPKGLEALMAEAALPERTLEVCLRGDLHAQVEELERQLVAANVADRAVTMADRGKVRQFAQQIETVRESMKDSTVTFRLRGLNRRTYAALLTAHPPRKDDDGDATLGYNADTFFPALIRACLVDPEVDDDQWQRLEPLLSSGQFDELVDTALAVSRRKVDVPFSYAASVMLRASDETSK